uniref:UBX domain-containing protein n=1 Tax=Magallana gigas TaxID=29159 RepID=A0A8W8NFW0_MAGGI
MMMILPPSLTVWPGELIEKLERILQDNEASLIAARAEREERDFTQTLRREQDAAILNSLKADQEKERERIKEELKIEIPEKPAVDDPDVIRIVLKLPHGSRNEKIFLKNQSLKFLYDFAFCHEDCPDDFHVVTNFPRRTLPCEPSKNGPDPPSFEEAGLGKNEMLFVQDNEA